MAMKYGFRLYLVQAFENQIKDQDPVDVSATSAARDRILDLLDGLHTRGTQYLQPRNVPPPSEPVRPTKTVTIGEPCVVRQDVIHFEVATGETDSHRKAVAQGVPDRELTGYSPEADYYMALLFPDEGDCFMVIAQTIGRRDAGYELFSRLTALDQEHRKAALADETRAREAARAAGEAVRPRQPPYARLLFNRVQAADNEYLDEIIAGAKTASAEFKAKVPSERGGRPEVLRRTLSIKLRDEDREIGRAIGRRWSRGVRLGEKRSHSDGVSELAGLLHDESLLDEGEEQRYNRAAVSVTNDAGHTTIAIDTLRDVFTYPVSQGQPSPYYHYDKAADRVEVVAAQEGLEVRTIDPVEVQQCLDDSTSAPS